MEDIVLNRYGTALDPLTEDEVPSKKPCYVEDQIVTDENGKRRFHGAFTGGFSAGFWNTVGSLEGWTPQSFKSSRSEKAAKLQQQPTDFMDSEDLGEFGIAPQRVQTTEDFAVDTDETRNNKRKFSSARTTTESLIFPVLEKLIEPVKDKVAIRILKSMGWKPGQGIGARKTRKEKKFALEKNSRAQYVMEKYGCDLNSDIIPSRDVSAHSDSESSDEEVTFAPDDFEVPDFIIKTNTFGLGYEGLSHDTISKEDAPKGHINLFENLETIDKSRKNLSITGQAFGVGAYEEEDEDIYARDDLTKYDFSLADKGRKNKIKPKLAITNKNVIEGFVEAKDNASIHKAVYEVTLPENYKPRNWAVRKSRFEPIEGEKLANLSLRSSYTSQKSEGICRFTPEERGSILNEKEFPKTAVITTNKNTPIIEIKEKDHDQENRSDMLIKNDLVGNVKEEQTANESPGTSSGATFKPFIAYPEKQERYEKFIASNLQGDEEVSNFLATLQPVNLSEWDREMEKKEFIQARKIYKPLKGFMFDRFVSESAVEADKKKADHSTEKKKNLSIVRTKSMWKPATQLCKRYNIPEPFSGTVIEKPIKTTKFSVFDYLENSVNKKSNFVTPVIVPKHIEKPKQVVVINASRQGVEPPVRLIAESKSSDLKVNLKSSEKMLPPAVPSLRNLKPKTELEKRVLESENKPAYEKIDLFKSIFENSDDEDEEKESESEIPKMPNTSQEIASNLLRNNSPPRGIFATLFAPKHQINLDQQSKTDLPGTNTNSLKNEKSANHDNQVFGLQRSQTKSPIMPNHKGQVEEKNITETNLQCKKKSISGENEAYGPAIPKKAKSPPSYWENKVKKSLNDKKTGMSLEVWIEKDCSSDRQKSAKKKSKKEKKSKHKIKEKPKKRKKSKKRKKFEK